jgi:Protein of unknown function DUF262/Protein of unknown function (DUF1524)
MLLSARILSVEDFFQLGTFIAASVQRDYIWDARHSEQLFNDIDRACSRQAEHADEPGREVHISVLREDVETEAPEAEAAASEWHAPDEFTPGYHLGEVMLHRIESGRFEIFDGLQRATTLTILLSVIRDLTKSDALKSRIHGVLNAGQAHRINLPGTDRTLITEVQAEGAAAKSFRRAVSERGRRIRESRNKLYTYLKSWNDARLNRYADFLLGQTFFVVAETDSQALARQVFITSNDRGVNLRPIDIFKGQIFDIAGADQVADILTKYWDGLLNIVGDGLEEFMKAFDFIQRQEPQGPDHLTRLADHIEKTYGAVRLHNVLAEVHLYASSWQDLHVKMRQSSTPVEDLDIWRLGFFKWFEWKPLALAWFKEFRDSQGKKDAGAEAKATKTFEKRFEGLHRACMIVALARFSAVDREKIFGNALKQWKARRDPLSARGHRPGALTFPPRQLARAVETLSTPLYDDDSRLSLLRWLESVSKGGSSSCDTAFASVEHVLPQRPAPGSQWLLDFPDEEERFSACHSIGNLALIDHAGNAKIANLDFHLKLPTLKEQAQKYRTLTAIADKTEWKSPQIRERAAEMIVFACKELNIPRPSRS